MKRSPCELGSTLARSAKPSAAVASGLLAPLAMGAPGDLDPGFADVGRLAEIIEKGPIWSVEALDGGRMLVAGGDVELTCSYDDYYCYYDYDLAATNFVSQLTAEGSVDPAFNAARPADIELRDAARQSDGKVIAVGRRLVGDSLANSRLVAYRLTPGGSLDTTFGVDGIFELAVTHGNRSFADAVLLDPDGNIVVAGSRGVELIVLRLLAGGTLDNSFGEGGVFIGPAYDHDAYLARTSAGGYRVTTSTQSWEPACRIIGLTADGVIDTSFGATGISPVETPSGSATACYSMEALANDRLLLTGITSSSAFATRLLATGAPDPAFAADVVADSMTEASAIAVADDGRILIAGSNDTDRLIMRLMADGALDPSFGNAGSTLIDLPSEHGSQPLVHALDVRPDGSLVAAGVDESSGWPFAVRLLGESGGDGPGVLSVVQGYVEAAESDQVVVNVRRTGGKSGDVSVTFDTVASVGEPVAGPEDYEAASGRLTWADGDMSTREITVQVNDDAGAAEEYEQFWIALSDAQGGAGIGTRNAAVDILPDGEPAGQFAIYDDGWTTGEAGPAQIRVHRNYYYEGAVSVTLTPIAGSATAGADFVAGPITVSWTDQDSEGKLVEIPITDDTAQEGIETFTVELSNPTGGAVIGPHSIATIAIDESVVPPPPPNRGGGGGSTGILSLLLLGLAELFRAPQRRVRMRQSLMKSASCQERF